MAHWQPGGTCAPSISHCSRSCRKVGPKDEPGLIYPSPLSAYKIVWNTPRPLIFINGCHTTAVEPLQALELVSRFVTKSHGAGVIGTEITIFEELATVFAEECFRRFFAGEPIGKAMRGARLKLLSEGNPLGLVYIPFVIAGLRIVDQSAGLPLEPLRPPTEPAPRIVEEEDWVTIGGVRLKKRK